MNFGKIINAFARFNPFVVKVIVENNTPLAYRNVFGLRVLAGPKAEHRAVRDYYVGLNAKPAKITKAMIGSPLGLNNSRRAGLLEILLKPDSAPKASPVLRVINPDLSSVALSSKLAGKRPEGKATYLSAVDKHLASVQQVQISNIEDVD